MNIILKFPHLRSFVRFLSLTDTIIRNVLSRYELCFIRCWPQADVMHLADDSTKMKLFMDVLDGTKAVVSYEIKQHVIYCCFLCLFNLNFDVLSSLLLLARLLQLTTPTSVPCLRLGSMMATLLLILLKQWKRSVLCFWQGSNLFIISLVLWWTVLSVVL